MILPDSSSECAPLVLRASLVRSFFLLPIGSDDSATENQIVSRSLTDTRSLQGLLLPACWIAWLRWPSPWRVRLRPWLRCVCGGCECAERMRLLVAKGGRSRGRQRQPPPATHTS